MNTSCHPVVSWLRHVTHSDESCHDYEGVQPHVCRSHVTHTHESCGVATISRLLKTIRLFCRISSLLQGSVAKETYNFKEPTNRSHPIACTGKSLGTHMKESRNQYTWVMPFTWKSQATHMKESSHIYKGVMSQIRMSHGMHSKELCHEYERV